MQQVTLEPETIYTLSLTGNDIVNIQSALMEIPAKFAMPIIEKMTAQVAEPKPDVSPLKIVPTEE